MKVEEDMMELVVRGCICAVMACTLIALRFMT